MANLSIEHCKMSLTYNNENCCQVALLLCRVRPAPDRGEVVLAHPGVDQHVHVGEVGEGDHPCAEQPCPVDVVVHVVRIHPQTCNIVNHHFLGYIVFILVLHYFMLGLQELWDIK